MRTLLVTGVGGAGRSTVAAATALQAARAGLRTALVGAAAAGPTGAAAQAGGASAGLTVLPADPGDTLRTALLALQRRAAPALDLVGAAPLAPDEITPLPGARDLALLTAVRQAASGPYELVVVDLPALPDALDLLALPGRLRRYLRRLLPPQRQAASGLRPVLGRLAGVPVPAAGLYETAARWDLALAAAEGVIEDPATTVRLVAEPGGTATEAVRTALACLALHGLRADSVVANRLLPATGPDPWLTALADRQRRSLAEWSAWTRQPAPGHVAVPGPPHPSAGPTAPCPSAGDTAPSPPHGPGAGPRAPLHALPHLGRDPRTPDDLLALVDPQYSGHPGPAAPGDPAPPPAPAAAAPAPIRWPVADRRAEDGTLVWEIPLPGARRDELDLVRRGSELVVTVGGFRRIVELPSALCRCTVDGAGLTDGTLRIRFRPDPKLWPRQR